MDLLLLLHPLMILVLLKRGRAMSTRKCYQRYFPLRPPLYTVPLTLPQQNDVHTNRDENIDEDENERNNEDKDGVNASVGENELDVNSLAFLGQFFSDETSVSRKVGGEDQLYTQKKFHHGPHRCFLDLEVRSENSLMLNYYLLSALVIEKPRRVFYSRCWIEHKKYKKRYILLAVFRTKCLHIRYEFLLYDPESGSVFLMCGVAKMELYVWLPEVELDHAHAKELLKRFICDPQHKLALIPGTPDKDEYGHFLADGFDPLEVALGGGAIPKRVRNRPNNASVGGGGGVGSQARAMPNGKGKGKQQPKKAKAITKKKPSLAKTGKGASNTDVSVINCVLLCTCYVCIYIVILVSVISLLNSRMRKKRPRKSHLTRLKKNRLRRSPVRSGCVLVRLRKESWSWRRSSNWRGKSSRRIVRPRWHSRRRWLG
jgi:hypothetical protein